jgi:topoisomerase-4 subunit B
MVKNYCYLNNGLTIVFNGENISENGLKDLLEETIHADDLEYPIIHLKERISKSH